MSLEIASCNKQLIAVVFRHAHVLLTDVIIEEDKSILYITDQVLMIALSYFSNVMTPYV